jgi:hypothetical protein
MKKYILIAIIALLTTGCQKYLSTIKTEVAAEKLLTAYCVNYTFNVYKSNRFTCQCKDGNWVKGTLDCSNNTCGFRKNPECITGTVKVDFSKVDQIAQMKYDAQFDKTAIKDQINEQTIDTVFITKIDTVTIVKTEECKTKEIWE